MAARLNVVNQQLLTRIRRFDAIEGWYRQGAMSCAHWLTWRIGLDRGAAREKVRVARALGALPRIDAAFAAGRLSYAQVRAITRVANAENEERLLEVALAATGAQLEQICRGLRSATKANPRRRRSATFAPGLSATGSSSWRSSSRPMSPRSSSTPSSGSGSFDAAPACSGDRRCPRPQRQTNQSQLRRPALPPWMPSFTSFRMPSMMPPSSAERVSQARRPRSSSTSIAS